MSEPTQDDVDLNYYEGVRKDVIRKLTTNGVPTDTEQMSLLLKAVDGGSKIVLTKKRLAVEQESAVAQSQQQELMAAILLNSPTAQQLRQRVQGLPVIEQTIPLPGETTTGTLEVLRDQLVEKKD